MSLFDKASLVITPNAVKEGKLYSVIPSDGSGDLDVVRATTATRVNSEGLIEVVPRNLVTYSEQFDNASWTKLNSTISANAIIAPNGTTTADKLVENSSDANHLVQKAITASDSVYTFSIYAKKGERNWLVLRSVNASLQNVKAWFNIDAGTVGTLENGATATITDVGNGWYKCSITCPSFSSGFEFRASTSTGNNVDSYTGDGTSGLYIWGAQLESNSVATSYFPTTDRLNIPRLDYSNGSCPSILLEPQRTNLALRSEEFDDVYWGKTAGTTVTANTTISPNGTSTADTVAFASSADSINKFISTGVSVVNGTSYTFSLYTKTPTQIIYFGGATGGSGTNVFNGSIDVGNGWYRQSITRTWSASGTVNIQNIILLGASGSVFIWGAQLEAGSYATSYIPTVASAVTRNVDVISKTGISDLINSEEGCFYSELKPLIPVTALSCGYSLSNGTNSELIFMTFTPTTNRLTLSVVNSNGANFNANIEGVDFLMYNKIAINWKQSELKVFINSFLVYSNLSFNTFTENSLSELKLARGDNQRKLEGNVKSVLVFPTALTNTELAQLTTI